MLIVNRLMLLIILVLIAPNGFALSTILVLGDSLSAAYGLNFEDGWVALLNKRLKSKQLPYRVINASVSGDTTSNGLSKLPRLLEQYQPKILIIVLGGNDGLRGLTLKTMKTNLDKIIKMAKDQQLGILLVGVRLPPNYGPEYTSRFQAVYRQLAKKYRTVLVPNILQNVDINRQLLQQDGIHPTRAAQPTMLENIWHALQPILKQTKGHLSKSTSRLL